MLVAVLPLLGSGFMVYKAFDNAQQRILNDEFVPEAWHNLAADQFFPDTFGDFEYRHPETDEVTPVTSWARQGIDETASCEDDPGIVPGFVKLVSQHGCRAVVRATYVDTTGTWVATIAVVVLGSGQDASQVLAEVEAKDPAQLVHAMPVPATPAADWSEEDRAGVAIDTMVLNEHDQPYILAVTLGYADGREVGELPDPWWGTAGTDNTRMLDIPASRAAGQFTQQLHKTITEPASER
ncbi:MAG TPA: hypothetical protein VD903_07140 [Pseudonocardia sp.]|nr:hypothetical protein [Pseudonocardia sp.]